jgi:hypothetical protein
LVLVSIVWFPPGKEDKLLGVKVIILPIGKWMFSTAFKRTHYIDSEWTLNNVVAIGDMVLSGITGRGESPLEITINYAAK